jgi:N-methylhydantoinase B
VPVVVAEPDAEGGRNVQVVEPMTGGTGGRFGHDGTDGRDPSISNLANNPVETVEAELGIEIERYALRAGSAGAGEWRGGCGLELTFRIGVDSTLVLARGMERALFRPWGMQGGGAGAPARLLVERQGAATQSLGRIDMLELASGDRVTLLTAGAGGYGDPFRRDPARVLDDVRRGLLDAADARREYGVAITEGRVDAAATARLRAAGRRAAVALGPERTAWDSVFAPALQDRLARVLQALPVPRRQAVRRRVYAAVLVGLPEGFPAGGGAERATAARQQFEREIATLEAAA